ncbi:MAG: FIST N-terminal domain-containing protein [Candidatus Methanoperedens sp.]
MKSITLFSNKKDHKQAARDIIEQGRARLDFKPDLALFYATLKYNGKYQSMLDIFHEEYGGIPQIGASVDGMIYPDDMRMDGAALVLCEDRDARIRVDGVKGKGAIESAEKLAKRIKCEKGAVVLHFPLVHVPGALKSAEFYARGVYYSNLCKGASPEKQKEYAGRFAEYCDRENIFYLPPTILSIFAKQTGYKVPIIGMNVMHTQVRFDSPHIFCNFEDIGGGMAALVIEKDGVNAVYDDIFPEKGETVKETMDIVRKEFTVIKEFKAKFEKNVLILLDDKPAVEAVKDYIGISKESQGDLIKRMGNGNLQVQMPYMLVFFNRETNGLIHTGVGAYYPFDLYPFFADISDCDEQVFLAYEYIDGKFEEFISSLKQIKHEEKFKFLSIDVGTTMAFGNKVFGYSDEIKKLAKQNYFGVLTEAPSIYLPKDLQKRNYITEVACDIFFTAAGTNVCLEI